MHRSPRLIHFRIVVDINPHAILNQPIYTICTGDMGAGNRSVAIAIATGLDEPDKLTPIQQELNYAHGVATVDNPSEESQLSSDIYFLFHKDPEDPDDERIHDRRLTTFVDKLKQWVTNPPGKSLHAIAKDRPFCSQLCLSLILAGKAKSCPHWDEVQKDT